MSDTEPCETQVFLHFQWEDRPFKTSVWRLLWKNELIRLRILPFIQWSVSLSLVEKEDFHPNCVKSVCYIWEDTTNF